MSDFADGDGELDDSLFPSLEQIIGGLDFDQDEHDRQVEEAFAYYEFYQDFDEDPFAEDEDLIPYEDPFAEDEDLLENDGDDWRPMEAKDADKDLRGPFPSFTDTLIYANELPIIYWRIVYDAQTDAWYIIVCDSTGECE